MQYKFCLWKYSTKAWGIFIFQLLWYKSFSVSETKENCSLQNYPDFCHSSSAFLSFFYGLFSVFSLESRVNNSSKDSEHREKTTGHFRWKLLKRLYQNDFTPIWSLMVIVESSENRVYRFIWCQPASVKCDK